MKYILHIAASLTLAALAPTAVFAQCSTATNIMTVAGNHTPGYSGDGGPGTEAQMGSPYAVVSDAAGNVFIADYTNNVVRKLNIYGIMSTVAGTGEPGYNGENHYATESRLNGPSGLAVDAIGNLYIADKFNERIRKVDYHTGRMTTVAGNGLHGGWLGAAFGNGGPATAAALTYPVSVTLDCSGNMYIADNGSQTVRKIDTAGIITRFAGTHAGGYNGDGIAATAARLNSPRGLATDCAGNVYIADAWNNRVRKVDAGGIISTFAGNGTAGYSGDGAPAGSASLWIPWGLTLDACGNLYICDYNNNAVRKVSGGYITTFAGRNERGYTGDGAQADSARIYLPSGVAIDGSNNIFVADYGNLVVRYIGTSLTAARSFAGGTTQSIYTCRNAAPVSVDAVMTIPDAQEGKTNTWTVAIQPAHGTLAGFEHDAVTAQKGAANPEGLTYKPEENFTGMDEFTVKVTDGTTSAYSTITVFVRDAPDAGTITGNAISATSTQMVNATGTPGGVWSSSDNTIATINNDGLVTAVANGVVTISYTLETSCGQRAATTTYIAQTRELNNAELMVFPNPNKGAFRINFTATKAGNMQLSATDVSGRVVYRQQITANEGVNTVEINMPENACRPGLLRFVLADDKAHTHDAATVLIVE